MDLDECRFMISLSESNILLNGAMAHGWVNQLTPGMKVAQEFPGANVNQLLPSGPGSYERISNQSHMTGIPVSIEKILLPD